jgi:hypothetical protein
VDWAGLIRFEFLIFFALALGWGWRELWLLRRDRRRAASRRDGAS